MQTDTEGKIFKILSIDGGGIRGLLPASYLQQIANHIGADKLHKYFDLIVGTSTGGIIALAIGAGVSIDSVVKLYSENGKDIFKRNPNRFLPSFFTILFADKYKQSPLQSYLKSTFGEMQMGELLCRVCIPSINLAIGKTVVFKTPHHPDYVVDKERKLYDIGLATSAAPIYFQPHKIGRVGKFVDGGLWANNPVLVGIAEGRKLGFDLNNIHVLSLGTGINTYNDDLLWRLFGGILKWRTGVVELTFQSQSQFAHFTSTYLLKKDNYHRIDHPFPDKIDLDEVSKVSRLQETGCELYRNTVTKITDKFFTSTTTKGF
jgi:patatin-like phospholipase/acyl hydrolase